VGCRELEVITWDYEESVELERRRVRFVPPLEVAALLRARPNGRTRIAQIGLMIKG
jgi:hypothetical protein